MKLIIIFLTTFCFLLTILLDERTMFWIYVLKYEIIYFHLVPFIKLEINEYIKLNFYYKAEHSNCV